MLQRRPCSGCGALTRLIFLVLLVSLSLALGSNGQRYLSPLGDDNNPGNSSMAAWRTFSRLCSDPSQDSIIKVVLAAGDYDLDRECLMYWDLEGDANASREAVRIRTVGAGSLKPMVSAAPSSPTSGGSGAPTLPRRRLAHFSALISANPEVSFITSALPVLLEDALLNSTSGPIATFEGTANLEMISCRVLAQSENHPSRASILINTGSALFLNSEIGPILAGGFPAITAFNASALNLTGCYMHDVWTYSSKPSSAIFINGSGTLTIDKSSFVSLLSISDATVITSSVPSFTVTNSNFTGGLGLGGFARFVMGTGFVSDCIFFGGISNSSAVSFSNCTVTFQSSFVLRTSTPAEDADETITGLLLEDSTGYIVYNTFADNRGSKCSALIMQGSEGIVVGNIFYDNWQASYESPMCLIRSSKEVGIFYNTFYDPIVVGSATPDLTWGYALSISNATASIHSNDYLIMSTRSALWISGSSNVTIQEDLGSVNTSSIAGLVLGGSNLKLSVSQLLLSGPTSFISTDGLAYTSRIFPSDSFTTSTIIVQPSSAYGTWIQHAEFDRVTLDVRTQSIVCCSATGGVADEKIIVNDANLVFRDLVLWYASSNPVTLNGYISTVVVAASGTMVSIGPTNTTDRPVPTIKGDVYVAGQARLADFIINGTYYLLAGATHYAYPSQWHGRSHPTFVNGDLWIEGALAMDEDLATNPFLPALNLTFAASDLFTQTIGDVDYSPSGLFGERFAWELLAASDATGTKHFMARPTAFVPYPIIDNTGGAILAEFSSEMNTQQLAVDAQCNGFIPHNTSQFDISTLHCTWLNDTFLRISSSKIPSTSTNLDSIETDLIKKSSTKIRQARSPVKPVAVIKPIPPVSPCGQVALDGSLSVGLGSLPGWYYWTVTSDGGNLTLVDKFLDDSSTSLDRILVPANLFDPAHMYWFHLQVFNWMLSYSDPTDPMEVRFTSGSGLLPLVHLEGGATRTHYAGQDLVINAQVEASECSPSDRLVYQWSYAGGDVISNDSPTLFLPSTSLPTIDTNLTLRLTTTVDTAFGTRDTLVEAHVLIIQPPFYVARTGRTHFYASDSQAQLSVEIRGSSASSSSSSTSPIISCLWNLYSCPSLDVLNAQPLVIRNKGGVQDHRRRLCSKADGSPFLFPVSDSPSLAIQPSSSAFPLCELSIPLVLLGDIMQGSYQFTLDVTKDNLTISSAHAFEFSRNMASLTPPAVSIITPPFDQLQSKQKLYFWAQVDGFIGRQALDIADLAWNISSGLVNSATVLEDSHNSPTLVIPYEAVISNEEVTIRLTATNRATGASSSFETSLHLSIPPFGGSVRISPSNGSADATLFTINALQWSTPFPPLKYQYSILGADSEIEAFVSPLLDDPLLQNVTLGSSVFYESTSTDFRNITLRLAVVDALGTRTEIDRMILLQPPTALLSEDQLQDIIANQLPRALNLSDWATGSRLIARSTRDLQEGLRSGRILNDTIISLSSALVTHSIRLMQLLPTTQENVGLVLVQLKDIAALPNNQTGALLTAVQQLVSSQNSGFGKTNAYSWASSTGLVASVASALSNKQEDDFAPASVVSILSEHGSRLLSSIVPGEKDVRIGDERLLVSSSRVDGNSATPVVIESLDSSVSFDAPLFQSASNGYLGYHVTTYNGTFPGLPESALFQVVSHTVIDGGRKRSVLEGLSGGRISTNFTTATLQTTQDLQCAKYDSASNSWSAQDCTTRIAGDGKSVVCDCGGDSAPLSLLFGLPVTSQTSPSSKAKGGLSSGAIAAIVVVLVVCALVALVILLALFVPAVNQFFRPFLKRSMTRGSTLSTGPSAVEMSHVDRNTSDGGIAPAKAHAWSKAQTPP